MKWKQSSIGIVLALGAGIGVYLLIRSHRSASAPEDEEQSAPTVITVQVGALKRMTLHQYVEGYGSVEPAPATTNLPAAGAALAPPAAGVVAKVNVVEGQRVKQGDVLMELNSGTVNFDYARQELERQQKLYEQRNTSLKSLQDAQAQLAALQVATPLSGTVVSLNVRPGAAVDVNTVVAVVMDLSRLVVNTDIPASQAGELEPGQEMQVLTEPAVTATLSYVSPTVDSSNGTVRARAALPPHSGLRPGQFVPLQIVTAVHTNCLAAPEGSVVTDVNGQSVIALVQGDQAIQTPVKTGFHESGWMEVKGAGLKAGDAVVTVGAYGLPAKTRIQVVNRSEGETSTTSSSASQAQ